MRCPQYLLEYAQFSGSHLTHEEILIGAICIGVYFLGKAH